MSGVLVLCKLLRCWLLALCAAAAGCEEDLAGGAACPVLCPGQALAARDTVLSPVSLDTTIVGYPPVGTEAPLLLAWRGDSLVTAVVARFDTLSSMFPRPTGPDTTVRPPVTGVDSASVTLTLDSTALIVKAPLAIEVYDVDTTGANVDVAAERALFRPDRLIASQIFPPEAVIQTDSVRRTLSIPLPPELVFARVQNRGPVRLGFLVRSDSSIQLAVRSTQSGSDPPTLRYGARADTATAVVSRAPVSVSSAETGPTAPDLGDYIHVLVGPPPPPPGTIAVGGLPASRTYMRFSLPAGLIESTTVVRATLLLTQTPNRMFAPADSTPVVPRLVLATPVVEPAKASLLLGQDVPPPIAPFSVAPQDSGLRQLDVVTVIRQWRLSDTTRTQRAVVLQLGEEGVSPQEVRFFSTEVPVDSLRPRLRLSYMPQAGFGLP